MSVLRVLLSPISITFVVIIVGYYIGQIRILNISLDLAGVLIFAVLVGWLIKKIEPMRSIIDVAEYQTNMKTFSTLGMSLFVASIGLTTGITLDLKKWKDIKPAFIGVLMVASAFVSMKVISFFDKEISISELLGSVCGALTTTPGLSAACELENVIQEEITLAYSCTYLFGVVATVLFAQIVTIKTDNVYKNTIQVQEEIRKKPVLCGLIHLGITISIGRFVGSQELFGFSLGNSGGVLFVGIIFCVVLKKYFPKRTISAKELLPFRNLGLVLFLVGNGIPAGMLAFDGFNIKIFLYGVVMTVISILFGLLLCNKIFKIDLPITVIAGGMTSTPAIGVALEKCNNICLNGYSLAYAGALITNILLIRIQI